MDIHGGFRRWLVLVSAAAALLGAIATSALGSCGPFTDAAADAFCPFVLEVFTLGITTGTTATTYDPSGNVSRLQMAAFLSRSVDGVLRRGNRRAPLRQFSTPTVGALLGATPVGAGPVAVESDGTDLWVPGLGTGSVSRVRGSDGRLLETWTGATSPVGIVVALGRVFVTAAFGNGPGKLYMIDPSQAAGAVTTVATNLGGFTEMAAFDGTHIWVANLNNAVSIVTPAATVPWTVTNVSTGFLGPAGILYDGGNVWVTDYFAGTLLKLNAAGAVLQTVTVGGTPAIPVFDGANIWIPNPPGNSVSVVRSSNGAVLATLTGNGLNGPLWAAFDGQRVLAVNTALGADSVSLWKAADLTAIGSFSTGAGTTPIAAASDGINFWIALQDANKLARF
jgi:hypothetical protein